MRFEFNDPSFKQRRQELRNNRPPAERILWERLKNSALDGIKFRRQYGVGPFVVDFYCPKLRLAIEIDGDSHLTPEAIRYDQERQEYIQRFNISFLRFTNNEVYENIDGVIEAIRRFTTTPGPS